MLRIQVLGKGMIPRGMGLAPRLNAFPADLSLIKLIMATPGLSVIMLHPEDNHQVKLTGANVDRMWKSYANYRGPVKEAEAPKAPATPAPKTEVKTEVKTATPAPAPEVKAEEKKEEVKVEEKPAETKEEKAAEAPKAEETKPAAPVIKPVAKPNK